MKLTGDVSFSFQAFNKLNSEVTKITTLISAILYIVDLLYRVFFFNNLRVSMSVDDLAVFDNINIGMSKKMKFFFSFRGDQHDEPESQKTTSKDHHRYALRALGFSQPILSSNQLSVEGHKR